MILRPARRLLASVVLLAGVLIADEVAAQPPSRVVLLRGLAADALSRQGTTLLTAELQAVGFEVVEVDEDPQHDLRQDIENVSARLQPVATFAILPVAGGTTVELWVEDRVTGKLVIRRVAVTSGPGAAADLALKAVELLRGSLLEVTVQHRDAEPLTAAAPVDVRRFVAAAATSRLGYFAEGFALSVGGSAVRNADLASAYAPVARVSWGRSDGYLFRLTASGLGSSPEVRAVEGEARVHQTMLLAEAVRVFRPRARIQPLAGAVAGIHHVSSSGTGVSSLFPNGNGASTAFAVGGEVGVAARLSNRVALVLDGAVLTSLPRSTIHIATRPVAKAGGLAVVLGLTLSAAF